MGNGIALNIDLWWKIPKEFTINGLVLTGQFSPEPPMIFMEKSMVSSEDFPVKTNPL